MPFLRTGGKRDHAARARARAGGGDMFLRMVSSCVVNLGCQTFEIHPILDLGCQSFASRESNRTRDLVPEKFPKRSATVPLDRRDGDDEVTRF